MAADESVVKDIESSTFSVTEQSLNPVGQRALSASTIATVLTLISNNKCAYIQHPKLSTGL